MTEHEEMICAQVLMMKIWEVKEDMKHGDIAQAELSKNDMKVLFKALVNYTSHLYFKDPVKEKVGTEEYNTERLIYHGALPKTDNT